MRVPVVVTILLASACGQQGATPPASVSPVSPEQAQMPAPPSPDAPKLDPAMGAMLAADKAASLARQCSRISPGPVDGSWQPSEAQIAGLEARLGAEIERQLAATSAAGSKPQDYYRQYAGFVIGGKQVIYVNGIHRQAVDRAPEPQRSSWKTDPQMICDGGTITFGAEFDPEAGTFQNFAFNGSI
jgi:hypothetical protein